MTNPSRKQDNTPHADLGDLRQTSEIVKRVIHRLETDEVRAAPSHTVTGVTARGLLEDSLPPDEHTTASPQQPPWLLQQFFDGDINLEGELGRRFPALPVMSIVRFRGLGQRSGRYVAALSTQDGSATLTIDADVNTRDLQMTFGLGSMLSNRFELYGLSDVHRADWMDLMRRTDGALAFLWSTARWEQDYLICAARKYYTNIYAFSPRQIEAAVRLIPPVAAELLNWLDDIWQAPPEADASPTLLTW